MIIIIRALSQWGKDDGDYDSPTSRDETSYEKIIKIYKKRERPKKEKAQTKNERKREKGQCYYPFTTLVLQGSTMIFMIESLLCCHFHILVGIFHYRTWLVYSNDGLPKNCPSSSWASKLDAHPLSFFLSFHTLIALVKPLHGNPYSLTLISIDGHLHSPLIRLVDVRLSYPFCLLHNHHSIPHILLCPWLMLMYCMKVEKVWDY